ncbi:hypothetical protein DFH11DRAFT_1679433 [Phellopilus nigrolimitatus]|nr:hypothetical protein DFH11DRAFT_1679433 [Phellopilus nigrolimitatus]
MQLWNCIAMQAQQQRAHAPAPNSANTSPASSPHANANVNLSGLASGLRPHYFNSASSNSSSTSSSTPPSPSSSSSKVPFSTLLAGVGAYPYHDLPSPPPSPRIVSEKERGQNQKSQQCAQQQVPQHALLALSVMNSRWYFYFCMLFCMFLYVHEDGDFALKRKVSGVKGMCKPRRPPKIT